LTTVNVANCRGRRTQWSSIYCIDNSTANCQLTTDSLTQWSWASGRCRWQIGSMTERYSDEVFADSRRCPLATGYQPLTGERPVLKSLATGATAPHGAIERRCGKGYRAQTGRAVAGTIRLGKGTGGTEHRCELAVLTQWQRRSGYCINNSLAALAANSLSNPINHWRKAKGGRRWLNDRTAMITKQ